MPRTVSSLIWAIARRVDSTTLRSYASQEHLRKLASLPRSSFFKAQRKVIDLGLVKIERQVGRREYVLVCPPPYPPESSLTRESFRSHRQDSKVSELRPRQRQSARQKGDSAASEQQIRTQLGKRIKKLLEDRFGSLRDSQVQEMIQAADRIVGMPDRLAGDAHGLSRDLQASGVLVSENTVREVLSDLAAVLHPTSQKAMQIFGAEIVAVRPNGG